MGTPHACRVFQRVAFVIVSVTWFWGMSASTHVFAQVSDRAAQRAEREAELERRRVERKAEQEKRKAEREAEQEERKAEREAEREKRKAEREAEQEKRKAEREAALEAQQREREEKLRAQEEKRQQVQAQRESERKAREDLCGRTLSWLENTKGVPPEVTAMRGGGGVARTDATRIPLHPWLLSDERFVSQFGKTYDQLSPEELNQFFRDLSGCQPPIGTRRHPHHFVVGGLFHPTNAQGYAIDVKFIREQRAEAKAVGEELAALEASEVGMQRYHVLQEAALKLEGFLDMSDREAFSETLRAARVRVVHPIMAGKTKTLMDDAQGYDGLVRLSEFGAQNRSALGADVLLALTKRQSELAAELVQHERQRWSGLGAGPVALERGVQWYREFEQRYARFQGMPEFARLKSEFEQERARVLLESSSELSRHIDAATDADVLKGIVARYLPLESDRRSQSGTVLMTRVAQRQEALHKQKVLSTAPSSAVPARAQSVESGTVDQTAVVGEPSESDMYDVVKAVLDQHAQSVRDNASLCQDRERWESDPGAAMLCMFGKIGEAGGGGEAMTITRFEKLGCARANGKPGYVCDFMFGMSGGAATAMGPTIGKLFGQGNAGQGRFLRSSTGWIGFFGED